MNEMLKRIAETLKTLKVDPAFENVDKWVGCILTLERLATEKGEQHGESSD